MELLIITKMQLIYVQIIKTRIVFFETNNMKNAFKQFDEANKIANRLKFNLNINSV